MREGRYQKEDGKRGERWKRRREKAERGRKDRNLSYFQLNASADFIRLLGCGETDQAWTFRVTSCEAAVVTAFSDTVRVWTTLPAPGRAAQQLSQAKRQKHELSIVTCICRKSEGFLINGGALN